MAVSSETHGNRSLQEPLSEANSQFLYLERQWCVLLQNSDQKIFTFSEQQISLATDAKSFVACCCSRRSNIVWGEETTPTGEGRKQQVRLVSEKTALSHDPFDQQTFQCRRPPNSNCPHLTSIGVGGGSTTRTTKTRTRLPYGLKTNSKQSLV